MNFLGGMLRRTTVHFELMIVTASFFHSLSLAESPVMSTRKKLYNFTIVSSGRCPEENTIVGFKNLVCDINTDDNRTSTSIENITSYQFFETGSSLSDLVTYEPKSYFDAPLGNGDTILLESKIDAPSSIAMIMHGLRSDGVFVTFSFAAECVDSCLVEPFEQDYSIGWIRFVSE